MTRLNVFVTPEELDRVKIEQKMSGMWLSGGQPLGDPQAVVARLIRKYNLPQDTGLDISNGEFCKP